MKRVIKPAAGGVPSIERPKNRTPEHRPPPPPPPSSISSPLHLPPSPEVTSSSNTHALEHLLEAKRQQFYTEYTELCAMQGWDAAKELAACEKALAAHCGAAHAVLFCTESAALQVLLEALTLTCYDRLYLPENLGLPLYAATVRTPATVHAVAIDPVSRGMDLTSLSTLLRKHPTRGRDVIIVSHVAGGVFPLYELEQLICDPTTVVIEDATEAFGAKEPSGLLIGNGQRNIATLLGFSSGSLLDVGGGGGVTTRDKQLEKTLRSLRQSGSQNKESANEGRGLKGACQLDRFVLSSPQTALLHAQLHNSAASCHELLTLRQSTLTRYMTALQEAFLGMPKDRQPQLAESLSDPHAAPSSLLLRIDCVQLGTRKERILHLFHKAGLAADWGYSWHVKKGVENGHEEERPPSCFTSLRLALNPSCSPFELLHLFRAFRDVLTHS